MQNKVRAFALAVALLLALAAPVAASATNSSFDDVPANHWAHDAVEATNTDGVMTGTAPRQFSPDNKLTFAEVVTIITRAFYADEVAASTASGEWFAKNMDVFKTNRLLGDGTEYFRPEDLVIRADLAIIMNQVLLDYGIPDPLDEELENTKKEIVEPNFDELLNEYKRGILVCFNRGLLTGVDDKGTVNAVGEVTRSQMATIYLRLRDYLKNHGASFPSAPVNPTPSTPVVTQPPTSSTTPDNKTAFKFLDGETTAAEMMKRINSATHAYRKGYLTNGKPITNENIQGMLAEIKETMPSGTPWTTDGEYFYSSKKLSSGTACDAFAYAVSDAIFGEDAPAYRHTNFEKLKVGDVIHIINPNTGYNHYMVAMSTPDASGGFLACSGNVDGEVYWPNGEVSTADIPKPGSGSFANSYIWTRY